MNNPADHWLQQASRARGVLACAVRTADQSVAVRVCRDDISRARVEEALKRITNALGLLQQMQVPCDVVRWTFESGQVVCALRPGGTLAALFINRDLATPATITRLIQQFQA